MRSLEKKWNLKLDARIVPHLMLNSKPSTRRETLKSYLIDAIGHNYGGMFLIY